jgi:hypothetical protein
VGQAFPFYWLGLGARSATLPEAMAAISNFPLAIFQHDHSPLTKLQPTGQDRA